MERQETKRRLVEAGLADSVDDERLDDPEALLHSSMSASGRRKFASFNLKVCSCGVGWPRCLGARRQRTVGCFVRGDIQKAVLLAGLFSADVGRFHWCFGRRFGPDKLCALRQCRWITLLTRLPLLC